MYFDRNRLDCFFIGTKKAPVQLVIPETVLRDLEIVDREAFFNSLHAGISEHALSGHTIIIVLAPSMYFEKDITNLSPEQMGDVTNTFLATVPFEQISHTIIKHQKKITIIAGNKTLFDALEEAFVSDQCVLSAVIPEMIIEGSSGSSGFDEVKAKKVAAGIDGLKEYNLLDRRTARSDDDSFGESTKDKKGRLPPRLLFLVLFFVILIAVLAVLILTQNKPTVKKPRQPLPAQPAAPTNIPLEFPSSPSATQNESYTIRLRNAGDFSAQAEAIKRGLSDAGIVQIEMGEEHIASGQTLIVFSKEITTDIRDLVQKIISQSFTPVIQDSDELHNIIDIVIGKKI